MTVPLNHAYVTGGDSICDRILSVIDAAESMVGQQAQEQTETMHQRMQAKAQADSRWRDVAGAIEHWPNEQGNVSFGVPDQSPHAQQAIEAEYGDDTHAPTALIRMGVLNGVTEMGWSMQEAFARSGY